MRDRCPAKDATCHKCKKKGHFSSQCHSKVPQNTKVDEVIDEVFLDTLTEEQDGSPQTWKVTLRLDGEEVLFKVDTGAEVTAISSDTLQKLTRKRIKPSQRSLVGPSHQPLKQKGQFQARLELLSGDKVASQTVYVVENLRNNLLGLPAILALQMVTQVNEVTDMESQFINKFPTVFSGLGSFKEEYQIRLKEGAKPHNLYTARNVPLPLREQVRLELEEMEKKGVISKVEAPTEWCAGMVVVPKKQGSVRICVDLKPLNESVLREIHPLPTVEDLLAQMRGAKIFSKLDANSGFWQIPLAEYCSPPSLPLTVDIVLMFCLLIF